MVSGPRRGKTGSINKDRVPGLQRRAVEDGLRKEAVRAVSDGIQVVTSKTYMHFYERTLAAGISAYRRTPALNAVKARGNAMGGLTLPVMPA
jgi:hypothetical protein